MGHAKPSEPQKQDLSTNLKLFVSPSLGFTVGAVIMQVFKTGSGRTVGTLVLYFGAQVKQLSGVTEWVSVIIFGCVFAAYIALNNFSLDYISIGVNLIIRSCLPLLTFVSQQIMAQFNLYREQQCEIVEIVLMCIGVVCAIWHKFKLPLRHEGTVLLRAHPARPFPFCWRQ